MKLIAFYEGYIPGEHYGGPVTSLFNFSECLGKEINIYIVCSNHDLNTNKAYETVTEGWNQVGNAKVMYLPNEKINRHIFSQLINEIHPNLLYVSSIFSVRINIPLLFVAKKNKIPMLLAPRGELNKVALKHAKLKKILFLQFFRKFLFSPYIYFQATSKEEFIRIEDTLKVPKNKIRLIPNIPSIPKNKKNIKKERNRLMMCFVGRIVENKNLLICLNSLKNVTSFVDLDVYGPIENKIYWDRCKNVLNYLPNNVHVCYRGVIGQQQMREKYFDYDCLISPTQFENYGQAIVEAMVHDTPVIISKGTTPWDSVAECKAGFVISLDCENGFTEAIEKISHMNNSEYLGLVSNLRKYVSSTFLYENLKQKYMDEFNKIIVGG